MSASPGPFCLWADCGEDVGLGHVMRCIGVAEALVELGKVEPLLLLSEEFPPARAAAESRGIRSAAAAAESGTDPIENLFPGAAGGVMLVDSYRIPPPLWPRLRASARGLAVVADDELELPVSPDLVLNAYAGARPGRVGPEPSRTRWLTGPEYYPLRREFGAAPRPTPKEAGPLSRVLVSFGGSHRLHGLEAVVRGLAGFVGSAANPLSVRLLTSIPRDVEALVPPGFAVRIETLAPSLREPLEWADLAILAAGTSRYEAAFVGTPALLVIIADNQAPGRAEFEAAGCARFLGTAGELSPARVEAAIRALADDPGVRSEMSRRGQALVDGLGCRRVAAALLELGGRDRLDGLKYGR